MQAVTHREAIQPILLTVAGVRDLTGLSRDSVYRYTRRRLIPSVHIGKRVMYSREAILRWIASGGTVREIGEAE
jgi:predicted DNA-binding transcriptional regulator AlpA